MIYVLDADVNHFQNLSLDEEDYDLLFDCFDGRPLGAEWTSPPAYFNPEDCLLPCGDFPGLSARIAVFSARAMSVLRPLIEAHGEFHRLNCKEQDLYTFNVTRVVNGLDLERSEYKTFSSSSSIMRVHRYEFIPSVVKGLPIFKLVQFPRGCPYVNDAFVDLVERNELTGFLFPRTDEWREWG